MKTLPRFALHLALLAAGFVPSYAQSAPAETSPVSPTIKRNFPDARGVVLIKTDELPGHRVKAELPEEAARGVHSLTVRELPSDLGENAGPLTTITAGTPLNKAIRDIAMIAGLGYVPSPKIGETIVDATLIPQGPALTMINTLVGPYGYQAAIQDKTVKIYGGTMDAGVATDVLYYKFRYMRFADIVETPKEQSSTAAVGSNSGGLGSSGQSGQAAGGSGRDQTLRQNLTSAPVRDFFKMIAETMLSDTGKIAYDAKNRTLIARDIVPNLERLKRYLTDLDRPVSSVYTKVRVLAITFNPTRKQGIDWTSFTNGLKVTLGSWQPDQSANVTQAAGSLLGSIGAINMPGFDVPPRSNLALSVPELSATLNIVSKYADVDQVMETSITSEDGVPGSTFFGRQLFIVVPGTAATGAGTASAPLNFQPEVGDTLTLVSEVGENENVRMAFKLNSLKQDADKDYGGTLYPQFGKRTTQQYVTTKSGETVLLAAYMADQQSITKSGISGLSSIPVLGPRLFGSTTTERSRTVVVFLLTPQVFRPDDPDSMKRIIDHSLASYRNGSRDVNSYQWPEKGLGRGVSGLAETEPKRSINPLTGEPAEKTKDASGLDSVPRGEVVPTEDGANAREVVYPGGPKKAKVSLLRENG